MDYFLGLEPRIRMLVRLALYFASFAFAALFAVLLLGHIDAEGIRFRRWGRDPFFALQSLAACSSLLLAACSYMVYALLGRLAHQKQVFINFISALQHDMNGGLQTVKGAMSLVDHEGLSEQQQTALKITSDATDKMIGMLEDVRVVAYSEPMVLCPRPVNIKAWYQELIDSHKVVVEDIGLSWAADLVIDSPVVLAFDPKALSRCVAHLIANAVANTQRGGIKVSVRSCKVESSTTVSTLPSYLLSIVVSDTGIGVRAKDWERVFLPFERGPDASGLALGIGLPLVKRFLASQLGDIRMQSKVGEGTQMTLEVYVAGEGSL